MKSISIITLTLFLLTSCSTSNELSQTKNSEQTWQLVKMTGSFVGSETTDSAMEFQEEIVLKNNGTFVKTRDTKGNAQTVTGIYTYQELEDGTYLELSYPSKNVLIGNCTSNLKETYWVTSSTKLKGTWLACDGPGMEYELK